MTQNKNLQLKKPNVWTIAGSDCTSGAGVQADLKTFHGLNIPAATIITAITAQNHLGVHAINAVSINTLQSQFDALLAVSQPRFIKIGMLANIDQVLCVSQWLIELKAENTDLIVVYDPVAIATSGDTLTEEYILSVVQVKLLPLVDYITPNKIEAEQLSAQLITDWSSLVESSKQLKSLGVKHVVITGGHHNHANDCVDFCDMENDEQYWLVNNKIATTNTHGTGCTFASALTAFLALDYHPRDAFTLAHTFVHESIIRTSKVDNYSSVIQGLFPTNVKHFPDVLIANSPRAKNLKWQQGECEYVSGFKPLAFKSLGLYPVVNTSAWIERLLRIGVKTIQLRAKHMNGDMLVSEIKQAIALGKKYQAQVFINDYWQLAIDHGAYGVHLGQEDLADADLVAIQQQGLRLGISTHGHFEYLKISQLCPSYIAIGAIFPTKTKDMTGQIQGLTSLAQITHLNSQQANIPLTAIGGININRASQILTTGIDSFAVVTAITQANDPELATKHLLSLLPSPQQLEAII